MATFKAFPNIILTEDDVPGAKLVYPEVENHSNIQLQRWLACRGLLCSGNKTTLIKRVKDCIAANRDKDISLSVDNGEWYEIKLKEFQKKLQDTSTSSSDQNRPTNQPPVPPITSWRSFPFVNIPEHFNNGHIHHYMIESVQFIDTSASKLNDDEDIHDLHTSKPLQKGKEYFKSGNVKSMKDSANDTFYFLKASVMASYRIDTTYTVMVTISKSSGFVKDASCTCVASGMGRCNHVAALLFALVDYVQNFGKDPQSATGKPCEWNKGRKSKKNAI